jgi:hypothetical protein
MRARKILKVFCPVCDEPFKEESLLLQHLDLAHDLSLGGDRPRTARVAADDAEDWVVVEPGDEEEEREAEDHGAARVDVTELSRWAVAKQLQSACPPAELMRPLLLSLTGAASEFKRRGGLAWFEQSFALAFPNGTLPSEFFRLPLFGSTVEVDALRVELKRLLCVLAHHFPECNFCPVLVSLLQLSLDVVGLSEEEALALLSRLLREKETSLKRVNSRQAVSLVATGKSQVCTELCVYSFLTFVQVKLLATAVHKLVLGNVKGAPLSELRIEAADYALGWCTRFFESLPPRYRSHALCLWAAQGSSAVIRLAIGLVSAAAAKASPAARGDKSRFLAHMEAWQGAMRDEEWAEVLRKSYKVSTCVCTRHRVRLTCRLGSQVVFTGRQDSSDIGSGRCGGAAGGAHGGVGHLLPASGVRQHSGARGAVGPAVVRVCARAIQTAASDAAV